MEEKKLSGEEGLSIITQMIQMARDDHHETGEGWLIWGWLLFAASISSALLLQINRPRDVGFVWGGMLLLGLVLYFFGHVRARKRKRVKTYVQDLLDKTATGFFISLFAMVAASVMSGIASFNFGYYYILYGFWMYIHGSAIRFRPLLVGAFVNWAAAIAIFLIDDVRYDMLVSAVAVLVGYLIPGYLLKAEYKRNLLREENSPDGV